MNNKRVRLSLKQIVLMLFVFQVVSACSRPRQTMLPTDIQHAYSQAIKDAEAAEYNEISRNLVAIVPTNDALRWNKDTGEVFGHHGTDMMTT